MVTLPGYLSNTALLLLEGFETFADWTRVGSNGTISDDTTRFSQGTHGFKLLTATAGTSATATKTSAVSNFAGAAYDVQALDVYVHDAGSVGKIARLGMFTTTGLTRGMATPTSGANALTTYREGWNRFVVRRAQFAAIGAGAWTDALPILTVGIVGTGLGQSITIDNWQYNLTPSVGAIVWTLHDAWDTLYTLGYPEFAARGLKGSLVADTARIGTAGHMSWAQYKEMVAAGWDVVNHFQTHSNPNFFTQPEVETELNAAEADFASNSVPGSPYTLFCAPGGGWSDNIRAGCAAQGYTFGHGITEAICYLPNPEPLRCEVRSGQTATNSVVTLEALYDSIKLNGGAVIHYVHEIGNSYGVGHITATDLATLLDYAIGIGVPIITLAQLAQLHAGQSVTPSDPRVPLISRATRRQMDQLLIR
jgi:peptidoglycan/xylan/chitin deacetylase (PgdA/CDA1 family)